MGEPGRPRQELLGRLAGVVSGEWRVVGGGEDVGRLGDGCRTVVERVLVCSWPRGGLFEEWGDLTAGTRSGCCNRYDRRVVPGCGRSPERGGEAWLTPPRAPS